MLFAFLSWLFPGLFQPADPLGGKPDMLDD